MTRPAISALVLLIFHFVSSGISADQTEEDFQDEFNGHFSDPSAKAAVFKHIDDMAFIDPPRPHRQGEERAKRNAIIYPSALWPNAQVPYLISSDFTESQRDLILRAMRHWEDNTCIRFFPRKNESYYLYVMSGDGCYSWVGRLRSYRQPQGLSLGPGCVYFRTAVHEFGHAVGFFHEHTRSDRDQYITVNTDNIRDGREDNFEKHRLGWTNTLGYGYDYASIMHYRNTAFAKSYSRPTIVAKDEGIVFGVAEELSPLDILKANKLYGCVAGSHPPITTFPPSAQPLSLPDGITCGGVMEAESGTFYSPGYPAHKTNQRCAWVIKVPDGYYIRLRFPELNLEQSSECSKDYVQVFEGRSLDPKDGVYLSSNARDGKFCNSRQIYTYNYVYDTVITIYYHTDGSNYGSTPRGLKVEFSTIDVNECSRSHRCHRCTNLPGSYRCECNDGYYHSPAARTCFDVNECAYDNGGCEHVCDNTGGSYRCTCDSGYYLQTDGLSCSLTPPPPPTEAPPQCGETLTSASGSFQTPSWPETYPFNFDCVWTFDLPSTGCSVTLTFDERAFGIAGKASENCTKDHLKIYNNNGQLTHKICDLTRPSPITTTDDCRLVFHAGPSHGPLRKGFRIVYRTVNCPTTPPPTAKPTTVATTTPTTAAPTTGPTTVATIVPPTSSAICGQSLFTELSGSFQTPSWPGTYPYNFDCVWTFDLPSTGCSITLTFDERAFGIAGKTSEYCPKDHLKIYNNSGQLTHTICDLPRPSPITTTDDCRLVFHAGPDHGPLRKGFRIVYQAVDCPTTPPPTTKPTTVATTTPTTAAPTTESTTVATTTPTTAAPTTGPTTVATIVPPTSSAICGQSLFTELSGSFQTPSWPATYPYNFDCVWTFDLPSTGCSITLTFDERAFGIAGKTSEYCAKDHLKIYNNNGQLTHKICDLTRPSPITTTDDSRLVFHAGPSHGPLRKGFRIVYQAVDCPTTPPPTTKPTTVATTTPTTAAPTTESTTVATTTPTTAAPTTGPTTVATIVPPTSSAICGQSLFTELSGSFQTPSWPATYPYNFDCVWTFDLPSTGCSITLTFDERAFGIAGKTSEYCPKDHLKIYNNSGQLTHTICDLTRPSPITTTDDSRLVFHAGPDHGPLRKGFRIVYQVVNCPTTPPPTTTAAMTTPLAPLTTIGTPDTISTTLTIPTTIATTPPTLPRTGFVQSPNWPGTYPVNIDLRWTIECPTPTSRISISLNNSPFWLGGQQSQGCPKDWVKVHQGETERGSQFGPFCFSVPPPDFMVQSNKALVLFHAGPKHHHTRTGFKLTYRCLA